jgi:hypothetical protein
MRLNSVHAIIIFDEMQNGAIWGLMHIHRDFEVDLYKAMEVFVSAKTRMTHF